MKIFKALFQKAGVAPEPTIRIDHVQQKLVRDEHIVGAFNNERGSDTPYDYDGIINYINGLVKGTKSAQFVHYATAVAQQHAAGEHPNANYNVTVTVEENLTTVKLGRDATLSFVEGKLRKLDGKKIVAIPKKAVNPNPSSKDASASTKTTQTP